MSEPETKPSPLFDFLIWVGLVIGICGNFGLAYVPLDAVGLWISLTIALAQVLAIMYVYMELREQHGARRFALPICFLFLLLLVGFSLLDVASRWAPTTPRWAEQANPKEERPAQTRTVRHTIFAPQTQRLPGQ